MAAEQQPKKTDRRRIYPEGEKMVRLTISMPESLYTRLIMASEPRNTSRVIREALEQHLPNPE